MRWRLLPGLLTLPDYLTSRLQWFIPQGVRRASILRYRPCLPSLILSIPSVLTVLRRTLWTMVRMKAAFLLTGLRLGEADGVVAQALLGPCYKKLAVNRVSSPTRLHLALPRNPPLWAQLQHL